MTHSNLPVPSSPVTRHEDVEARPAEGRAFARAQPRVGPFDAQLIGQSGVMRGLKGGEPVLNAARAAYLDAEYSGSADRRPPVGILKVREI